MKMTKSLIILSLILPLTTFATTATTNSRPKLTPEQRKAKIQLALMKRHGGLVRDTRSMRGSITVINAQSKVANSELSSYIDEMNETVRFHVKLTKYCDEKITLSNIDNCFKKSGADIAVFIVDSNEFPGLLVAPENLWALINVNKYQDKNTSIRVGRELARAIVMVGGGFGDGFSNSLLGPITDPRQLDNFKSSRISFEVAGRMVNYLDPLGLRPFGIITYKESCKLGIAAPPTNEYQKAIWHKVRSEKERGPTNPIEIPMPKKK